MIKIWLPYVIASVFIVLYVNEGCNNREIMKQMETLRAENDSSVNETTIWKDKFGVEHAMVEQMGLDIRLMASKAQKTAAVLNIKPKDVQSITVTQSSFKFKDTLIMSSRDPVIYPEDRTLLVKRDKWMHVAVDLRSYVIGIEGRDSLTITEYSKKKWFLGQRKSYIDISNASPYITNEKVSSYRVNTKQPLFIVGPGVSLGINGQVIPSLTVLYYPLTLKIR